jgi:hypothetical protein
VNRNLLPSNLPQSLGGIRTRYLVMDRLHVTRSYATGISSPRHCMPHHADSGEWVRPRGIDFP